MPFQALPIAFRKVTGSPLAKLLMIYLVHKCEVGPHPCAPESAMMEFDWTEAAAFCECGKDEIFATLEQLERLRLAYPSDSWLAHNKDTPFRRPEYRWDFICVALPVSSTPAAERKRFKASDDQFDTMWTRDGYRCVTCNTSHDDVKDWHVDHIIPRSVGGADVEENCQAICGRCNNRKGPKLHFVDFIGGRK